MPVISNVSLEIDNDKTVSVVYLGMSFARSNDRKVARDKYSGVNKNSDKLPKSPLLF